MKHFLLWYAPVILVLSAITANAQVGINTTGAAPDNSAMLDVVSTSKGMLIPRMTAVQRDAIPSPATGLMVFVTDFNKYFYYNGVVWIMVVGGADDDWIYGNNIMYCYPTYNVGIGMPFPDTKLYVVYDAPYNTGILDIMTLALSPSGTPTAGLGGGLLYRINTGAGENRETGRIASVTEYINYPSYSAGMLFQTKPLSATLLQDALYLDPDGNIGIGTRDPGTSLEISDSPPVITLNANSLTSPRLIFEENGTTLWNIRGDVSALHSLNFSSGSHSDIINFYPDGGINHQYQGTANGLSATGSPASGTGFYVISSNSTGNGNAVLGQMINSSAGTVSSGVVGRNFGLGYGVAGQSQNSAAVHGKNTTSNNYGYIGSPSYGLYGSNSNGNYGYFGSTTYGLLAANSNGNYGYAGAPGYGIAGKIFSTALTNYAVYGDGINVAGADGTGYGIDFTLGGVKGYNYWGNPYTFGVAGYSYLDYNRSGGCLGSAQDGTVWGSMGYKASTGTIYGGYFTSTITGTGKGAQTRIDVGIGAWGDLFGADIHGNIYGIYAEGDDYALYAHGDIFRDGLDVHLQSSGNSSSIPLYTMVATDAIIQTCGYATLTSGVCNVTFDASFSSAVSSSQPIVVTVTPNGNCNGVYLTGVTSQGFKVVENNNGKSSVTVSYIAIGKRAGYENPVLPAAVVASDYIEKLSRGLHNDSDTHTNGEGLYYEAGNLTVGIHPSTLPDPNKPPSTEVSPATPE